MPRTGAKLAPPMAVEQAVDITYGEFPAGALDQLRVPLLGGQNLPLGGLPLEAPQKRFLFFERQIRPTATAPPLPVQSLRTLAVVLADPKPDGLFGDTQPLGDLVGRELADLGLPYGQTPLVALLVGSLAHPNLQFVRGQPRLYGCWRSHHNLHATDYQLLYV